MTKERIIEAFFIACENNHHQRLFAYLQHQVSTRDAWEIDADGIGRIRIQKTPKPEIKLFHYLTRLPTLNQKGSISAHSLTLEEFNNLEKIYQIGCKPLPETLLDKVKETAAYVVPIVFWIATLCVSYYLNFSLVNSWAWYLWIAGIIFITSGYGVFLFLVWMCYELWNSPFD